MKKKIESYIILTAVMFTCIGCLGQSAYLTAGRDEVVRILNEREMEVMAEDSGHIHSVDGKSLRNVITYFSAGICTSVVTTFQRPEDFERVAEFMKRRYESVGEMNWRVAVGNGWDCIVGYRRGGYDVIEENFVKAEDKQTTE